MTKPEKSQLTMDPKENHLRDICKDVVEELNRSQNWELDPEDRNELLQRICPHVAAKDSGLLHDFQIIELARKITYNYYQEGLEVEQLGQDLLSVMKYEEFIKQVIHYLTKKNDFARSLIYTQNQSEDFEDFVQNIWLKVFSKKVQFHFCSKFTTWVFAVINNSLRERIKKEMIKKEAEVQIISLDQPYGNDGLNLIDIIPGPMIDYIDSIEKEKDIESVIKIILNRSRNPHRDRRIWQLALEGDTHRKVAGKLGMPINTVSTILNRIGKMIENHRLKEPVMKIMTSGSK